MPFLPYLSSLRLCRVGNTDKFFKEGVTYGLMSRGAMGARLLQGDELFEQASIGVIPGSDVSSIELIALLNSRIISYLLRVITQDIKFNAGYVENMPFLRPSRSVCAIAEVCIELKKLIVSEDLKERSFHTILPMAKTAIDERIAVQSLLHTYEGLLETSSAIMFDLGVDDIRELVAETDTPAGWLPLIAGYESVPPLPTGLNGVSLDSLARQPRRPLSPAELEELKRRLRAQYEAGPGGSDDADEAEAEDGDQDSEQVGSVGSQIAIPTETFVEELSVNLGVHPISVYSLLKEGRANEGWRCLPEEKRLNEDKISVLVLQLLGHRWPRQVEADLPVPDWAVRDGIIPLTTGSGQMTLADRVETRIEAEVPETTAAAFNRDFAYSVGQSLDDWLASRFFTRHITQLRKRPIAWQLQNGKFTAKNPPAFACLLYYHKLDADILPKLRSQYVSPLRQRLETELRGIMAVAAEARSDRQEERRVELDDPIRELQRFETILESVAGSGFGPTSLIPELRQYAVDDAMLALKARWLRRLTELIAQSSLPEWLAAADRTELHPDLRSWIADAMAHIGYFCARVGPKPPDQKNLAEDPTAADLAGLVSPHANSMLKDALDLACEAWWKQFEEVVLAPEKERIKELKEEQKKCDEQLKADAGPSTTEIRRLKNRVKEIKQDVKILTAEIKQKTARADAIRAQIKSWQSEEPSSWGDWLAGQPLFDQVSGLDGRRATPTTIAEFIAQESLYAPDINDGVRVNIAPLQKAGLLAADVLASKDIDKAIADRAEWRADERRWVREGKLPNPGWWLEPRMMNAEG